MFGSLTIGRENLEVSHLQFADDTVFAIPTEGNLNNLVRVLDFFFLVSSLKINMEKSILLGINLEEKEISHLANVIGCAVGNWPVK